MSSIRILLKFLILILMSSCATDLKDAKELEKIPVEFEQKMNESKKPVPLETKKTTTQKNPIVKKEELKKVETTPVKKEAEKKSPEETPPKETSVLKTEVEKETPQIMSEEKNTNLWPFGIGEKLTYILRYGPIEGGVATLEVGALQKLNGEPVLHYTATAKSYKFFDFFYKIDNKIESWVRIKDHLPVRQEMIINESGQWGKRLVIFDPDKKKQHYFSHITRKGKNPKIEEKTHDLINNPQDIFGAGYFYRFLNNLADVNYPIHDRTKHWNNKFVYEKTETIVVKGKTYNTNRYKLLPRINGKEKLQGNVTVWLTNDNKKYMVKFNGKIAIGSITGELSDYKEGRVIDYPLPKLATPTNLNEMGELP